MHDLENPMNSIDHRVATSPELLGKECCTCVRVLAFKYFTRDSSYRDGYRDRCYECETAPRMSNGEHLARLREQNYNSSAVKKQRWQNQEDFENEEARQGRWMQSGEFISRLKRVVPNLFITEGNFLGDLAVYRTYPCPQPDLDGNDFKYLFYLPTGWMPENSFIEFDERDIPIREKKRGWRTPLLRLIKAGLLTEQACDEEFGRPTPGADAVWDREMYRLRMTNAN